MLHVANGETTAKRLRAAGLEGDVLGRDDILMEGPLPNALRAPADWLARGDALEARLGIPARDYVEARLAAESLVTRETDELVLWSEADVFCQANLLRLLALPKKAERVSLVLPSRGRLATLDEASLVRLSIERRPVPLDTGAFAAEAWAAFCAPDPRPLVTLAEDPRAWPALRDALRLHLARLPDAATGLGAVEHEVLMLCGDGETGLADVLRGVEDSTRTAGYGVGDLQAARVALDLHESGLLAIEGTHPDAPLRERLDAARRWRLRATPLGNAVLHREAKAPPLPARHVGGVHLAPSEATWSWDGRQVLRHPPQTS